MTCLSVCSSAIACCCCHQGSCCCFHSLSPQVHCAAASRASRPSGALPLSLECSTQQGAPSHSQTTYLLFGLLFQLVPGSLSLVTAVCHGCDLQCDLLCVCAVLLLLRTKRPVSSTGSPKLNGALANQRPHELGQPVSLGLLVFCARPSCHRESSLYC